MAKFSTALETKLDDVREKWVLTQDLIYHTDKRFEPVIVPMGFMTDFASVPRLPLAYWLMANVAHQAAVVHDYLYRTGDVSKELADDIFLEAMEVTGVPAWRRYPMYWAVKCFGSGAYKPIGGDRK